MSRYHGESGKERSRISSGAFRIKEAAAVKCPRCRAADSEVFNSRLTKSGNQIWRRRRCAQCRESFTTYESADLGFLKVVKAGKPQAYSRATLFSSVYGAFTDITDKPEVIDAVTATIESKILDTTSPTISTAAIADIVLQTLKHYSTGAFIRYLSEQTTLHNEAQLRKELKKY